MIPLDTYPLPPLHQIEEVIKSLEEDRSSWESPEHKAARIIRRLLAEKAQLEKLMDRYVAEYPL